MALKGSTRKLITSLKTMRKEALSPHSGARRHSFGQNLSKRQYHAKTLTRMRQAHGSKDARKRVIEYGTALRKTAAYKKNLA